jgi:3-oxoacyl-(acyl-carrier-protein) synthase III
MGGGLLQLVAYGAQDAYISGNPQITFWKGLFKRHTNFAMEPFRINFTGQPQWGTKQTALVGRHADLLYVDGGASQGGRIGKLRMQGQAVFRHAVGNISEAIAACCAKAGVKVADIDWFVPHQANRRILEGVARRMGLDEHKVITTVTQHGNTSAASVPLAFEVARQDGRIQKGDLVLLEAMGGGFTWGASLIRL